MKTLLLVCLIQLACACTPHEVRCSGRLEPINAAAATTGAAGEATRRVAGIP
ncbi:MAG TPA: hypothetical protein VKQ31_08255 [Steroidobacteraceae bacterium]|nr:hypothetical protein [Steroidobacteraceae bacterium]